MILYIQIILITVLLLILTALYVEERRKKQAKISRGRLTHIWDGCERRRFVRISVDIPVRYSFPKGPNNIKAAKTRNISIGGMCITINEKLMPHAALSLAIEPAGSRDPILVNGEVAWVKESAEEINKEGIRYFDIGIEFKSILPKEKKRLFGLIKECKNT